MLQGVIKSMPAYSQHHRGGVMWPREGREFCVVNSSITTEQKILDEASKLAREIFDDRKRQDPEFAQSPELPVVYHVAKPTATNPNRTEMRRGRIIDIPGKPVVMDEVAYEHLKESFGSYLHCEPIGGVQDAMEQQMKIATLERENERLKSRLAENEPKQAAKK